MSEFGKMFGILKNCVIKSKKPTKIWYGITERCNSHCKNCNIWKTPSKIKELTPSEIYTIFSDPLFQKVDTVLISGGEPTCRTDLFECVFEIHRALPNAKINIATNGNLPEFYIEVIHRLLNAHIPVIASTSLEGYRRTHDEIRGKGSWERVEKLIMMLLELRKMYDANNVQIGFGTVLTDKNADEIQMLAFIAEKLGLFYLIQWYNQSSYYSNLDEDANRTKERQVVESLDNDRFGLIKEKWLDYLDGKPIKFNCYALREFLVIKANGDVVPCLSQWNWKIGNLRDESPEKVWNGWLRQKALQTVKGCNGCLNSWGFYWSAESDGWPYVRYFIKHPREALRKLI